MTEFDKSLQIAKCHLAGEKSKVSVKYFSYIYRVIH